MRGVMHPLVPAGASLLSLAVVAIMAPACAQAPVVGDHSEDRAISAGNWTVASVEWDGKPVDPEFLALLQVAYKADGSWAVLFRSVTVAEGTSTNHQTESPKTFEMATLGSDGVEARRYAGIYRLDGDTRVLCIVPEGKRRPAEFSAPRRSGRMLVTLKRAGQP